MFDANSFRKELVKIMPGYNWTVHKGDSGKILKATGTQSSGFNRLSTLSVERSDLNNLVKYTVKSSGYGVKSPWLHENSGATLASALRDLQEHYEYMANLYDKHASDLKNARKAVIND